MYEAIKHFTDLTDGGHPYNVGDAFPRKGLNVSDERIRELSSSDNKRGIPLIKKVNEKVAPVQQVAEEPKKKTSTARGKKNG